MLDKIKKAREFAIVKHENQKYGEYDYSYHLDKVFNVIKKLTSDEDYYIAAYLHDVLEDTKTTKKEIIDNFGENVYDLIFSVTGEGNNRKERKISTINKLKNYPKGIILKMADCFANMEESKKTNEKLFLMYLKELTEYEPLFNNHKCFFNEIKELIDKPKKPKI